MEVKEKNKRLLIVVGVLLLFGGLSLAYFVTKILTNGYGGNTSVTTAVINGATVNVEGILSFEDLDILPGHKSVSGIKVTATGNNELIPYNLIWKGTNTLTTPLNFTIYKTSEEINVTATCEKKTKTIGSAKALSEECEISNIDRLGSEIATGTINNNDTKVILAKDEFITATSTGDIKYYYVILEYPNLDEPQNEDLSGEFEGEVTVEESNIKPDINILAAYVVQEDGTYKEVDDIPQEGYQLNNEKSTCSNGANVRWNYANKELITSNLTKSGTSCYLYFDKYVPPITMDNIIAGLNAKTTAPDFSQVATTDEGVYSVSDGMYGGTSYYWRGATTTNYVKFAGFCWRIVRINGDKTMRLIYDGTTCHANGTSTIDSLAVTGQAYNLNYNRSEYVGYTYSSGSQRTTSGTDSNLKSQNETWYNNNLASYVSKIADGKFCNDRNVASEYSWSSTPTSTFYYEADNRITTGTPTLSCLSGDVYTLKIGAITTDEGIYAGGKFANNSYYLYNGQTYWTMSPYRLEWYSTGVRVASVFTVNLYGSFTSYSVGNTTPGLRPVINLRSDVTFNAEGKGTLNNPYVVAD